MPRTDESLLPVPTWSPLLAEYWAQARQLAECESRMQTVHRKVPAETPKPPPGPGRGEKKPRRKSAWTYHRPRGQRDED